MLAGPLPPSQILILVLKSFLLENQSPLAREGCSFLPSESENRGPQRPRSSHPQQQHLPLLPTPFTPYSCLHPDVPFPSVAQSARRSSANGLARQE